MAKLKGKIDEIIDSIIKGETYREIAEKYKVGLSTLFDFLAKDEHSPRTREALDYSASIYADKAENILIDIDKDSNAIEMARARELSNHYRWKAGKRSPKEYGDRVQQDVKHSGEVLIESEKDRIKRIAALKIKLDK